MERTHEEEITKLMQRKTRAVKRVYFCLTTTLAALVLCAAPALAEDNALTVINNLTEFVFSAIRALGVIILGWGIVQIGMSLQSHDSSQRTNGFLGFFGGLLIAFSKTILDTILN